MSDDPSSAEAQLHELIRLTDTGRMDWLVELAKCSALLTLISDDHVAVDPKTGGPSVFGKAKALYQLFETVLENAHLALSNSRASAEDKYAMPESQVLAAGALLGLVTEWPSQGNTSNPLNMRWRTPRSANKSVRQQIGAAWIGRTSERTMALNRQGEICLHTFHARLGAFPNLAIPEDRNSYTAMVLGCRVAAEDTHRESASSHREQPSPDALLLDRSLLHVIRTLEVLKLHMYDPGSIDQVLATYRQWHEDGSGTPGEIVATLNNICNRYLNKSLSDLTGSIRVKAAAPEYPPHRMLPWCTHQSKPEDSLVLIPGGLDPFTGEQVAPFYMATFTVTAYEWYDFLRKFNWPSSQTWKDAFGRYDLETEKEGVGRLPAVGMTYYDCVAYCFWLWATTPYRFRLPTEAEWNFAATGGKRLRYPWGDELSTRHGWFSTTHPKASQEPTFVDAGWSISPDRVHGLAGNVWEYTSTLWSGEEPIPDSDIVIPDIAFAFACENWWNADIRVPHHQGQWQDDVKLVMKGGSYGGGPEYAAMDSRIYSSFYNYGPHGGFRLAISVEPAADTPTPEASPLLNSHLQEVRLISSSDFAGELEIGRFARACGSIAQFGEPAIPPPDAPSSWEQLLRMRHG